MRRSYHILATPLKSKVKLTIQTNVKECIVLDTAFHYRGDTLYCEDVPLVDLVKEYQTPLYVYSANYIRNAYQKLKESFGGFPTKICYSLKSNPNIWIGKLLADLGAGADVTSGGELFRALKAGFNPEDIVFAGVGKSSREIVEALRSGVGLFSVESEQELRKISELAQSLNRVASISIRVNPNIDPHTHEKITTGLRSNKFGVPIEEALRVYQLACTLPAIRIVGIGMHIGSQLVNLDPVIQAANTILDMAEELINTGIRLEYLDIGGGFGIKYKDESPEDPEIVAKALERRLRDLKLKLIIEPGRFISGPSGALLTSVLYTKTSGGKKFVIVDAGMNALIRPALYEAYHHIQPLVRRDKTEIVDVVGPICESSDYLAKDRLLPQVFPTEAIAVLQAGAYGFAMASEYNGHPKPAELLVDGNKVRLIRKRQMYEDLIRLELEAEDL